MLDVPCSAYLTYSHPSSTLKLDLRFHSQNELVTRDKNSRKKQQGKSCSVNYCRKFFGLYFWKVLRLPKFSLSNQFEVDPIPKFPGSVLLEYTIRYEMDPTPIYLYSGHQMFYNRRVQQACPWSYNRTWEKQRTYFVQDCTSTAILYIHDGENQTWANHHSWR